MIHELLKERRWELKLRQKEIVEKTGYSQTYLSQIERGRRKPSLECLNKICLALDIPLGVLLFLSVEPTEFAKRLQKKAETSLDSAKDIVKDIIALDKS